MNDTTKNKTTVSDCLRFLEAAGWSELIATRWRRQIERDLRAEFGDSLSEDVLNEAVSVVLYPYKELPEEEYEYLEEES